MIEAMKQWLEALEKSQSALAEELSAWDFDSSLHHIQESHDLCGPAITSLRQAIAELESQKPVAWRLESGKAVWLWFERTDPEANSALPNDVTAIPLYAHPPQRTEQEPVAWGVFEGNLHDMFFSQEEAQEMADLKGTHAQVRPLYATSLKEKNT
jgi:hypothetical protein